MQYIHRHKQSIYHTLCRGFSPFHIGMLLLLIFMSSCIPDPLPVDNLPQLEPKTVVFSQYIPDTSTALLLTKSLGALDASEDSDINDLLAQIALTDATAWISDGIITDTLLSVGSGVYVTDDIDFQEGISYSLTINSESLGEATASTTLLPLVSFDSVNASLYTTGFDSLAQVNFSITDPLGPNFYMVNVQPIRQNTNPAAFLDPQIFTYLFTDSTFDGQTYSDEFRVFFQDYSLGDTVLVSLGNISAEYYEFLELRVENRYNFNDFGTEPINYPSNVTNGYGFFNLYQADTRTFELE